MFGYESPPLENRSKKDKVEDYCYRVRIFSDKVLNSGAIIIESYDDEGLYGNPVLFDLKLNGPKILSNSNRMNFNYFMDNLDSYLKEGMKRSGLNFEPKIVRS